MSISITSSTDSKEQVEQVAANVEKPAAEAPKEEAAANAAAATDDAAATTTEEPRAEAAAATPPADEDPREARLRELQERVEQLTWDRNRQKVDNDDLRQRLEVLSKGKQPEPEAEAEEEKFDEPVPKLDDFDSIEEWAEARENRLRREIAFNESKKEKTHKLTRQQQAQQEALNRFGARMMEFKKTKTDYDQVMKRAQAEGLPSNPAMEQHIFESELGPQLTYYLATHPDECKEIAALPFGPTIARLGRLEERLAAGTADRAPSRSTPTPPTRQPEQPDAPIDPVKPKATAAKSVEQMSHAEYKEWRKNGGGLRR